MPQIPAPTAVAPGSGRARYEGAWARLQTFERDPQFGVQQFPDPEHRVPGAGDPNPSWNAPVYQDVGPAEEVVGLETFDVPAPVMVLDRTPNVHTEGGRFSTFDSQAELQASHNVDEGAADKNVYYPDSYQFFNEHYYGVQVEGSPVPAVALASSDALPFVRGINASPVNNGASGRSRPGRDGAQWRPGWYLWSNVNRRFAPPRRQHDYRYVRPDVVTHIGDSPPPVKSDQYSSPFTSLQRFITDIKPKPMARRIPAPFDEDLIYDGSDALPQLPVGMHGW